MTLYTIENLKQNYAAKSVLDIKNFQIQSAQIVGLVGSNGSGKSTLLRHLAFLEKPLSGTLCYKNRSYQNITLSLRREIALLMSEPYLLHRSVKENLLFGLRCRNDNADLIRRACEALELVGLTPHKFLHRKWYELSSGETERVAFAARLILKPEVLLLDEPTNSLDKSGIPKFSEAISYANKEWKTTVVIATHDLSWLSNITPKIVGLHFGRLVEFSMTNLILGAWENEGGALIYRFADGQTITLEGGLKIGAKRGVAINPRAIKIGAPKRGEIALKGVIKEITHLPLNDEISIKAQISDKLLECIIKRGTFAALSPAQQITLSFGKDDVRVM